MSDKADSGKRDFLKGAAMLGAASGLLAAGASSRDALAQVLETGIRPDSMLPNDFDESAVQCRLPH